MPSETDGGDLQQPDDASASYPFNGSGAVTVRATWTVDTPLTLTVTCPGGSQSTQGTESAQVTISDANGACDATLSETVVDYDPVPYTLIVGPADGS
jgi:hypothetical protein